MGVPPSDQDPTAVRDLADSILADARYDPPPESLVDRVLEWIGDQISRVLGSLLGGGGSGSPRPTGPPPPSARPRRATPPPTG